MRNNHSKVVRRHRGGCSAFTLPELVLVCLLGALLGGLVWAAFVFVEGAFLPKRLLERGEVLAQAPCFQEQAPALALHAAFREKLEQCTVAYAFGGEAGLAEADWRGGVPLALESVPVLGDLSPGFPRECEGFYVAYAAALGHQDKARSAEDFTVLLIGKRKDGAHGVLCLVQNRSTPLKAEGKQGWLRREVRLWTDEGEFCRYAFAERVDAGVRCGVVHSWFKAASNEREEGPATVVFPDPWVFAEGVSGAKPLKAASRFSYFIPVYPKS